jgi:hypothetical protein
MAEGERPQKRPERRRRHRPDPEHRLGAPSTQHAAVIDAVPRPLVTIRAGGPLDGVVTITAIPEGNGRSLVESSWTQDGIFHHNLLG